jgi:hypothetical protein
VKIDEDSSLEQVAAAVAATLDRAGIRAVLTGGAAAVIYTGGEYQSEDLDFILQSSPTQARLDQVLSEIGFTRKRDHYVHQVSSFFIEFPRGPLSIGRDIGIRPVEARVGRQGVLALSATDSCRDRLAAFYHWNDRQSLETAVRIALRNRVDFQLIRGWSAEEGMETKYNEFRQELTRRRKRTS